MRKALVTNSPLRVSEGIYIIRNVGTGNVLESEHHGISQQRHNLHTYIAPLHDQVSQYQLWTVFKLQGKEFEYSIRNFATGGILDIFYANSKDGTQVIGHSVYDKPWQTWAFYGSNPAAS